MPADQRRLAAVPETMFAEVVRLQKRAIELQASQQAMPDEGALEKMGDIITEAFTTGWTYGSASARSAG